MAMIKCPECEHEISDSAAKCPNCGYQLKKPYPKEKIVKVALIGIGLLAVVLLIVYFNSNAYVKKKMIGEWSCTSYEETNLKNGVAETHSSIKSSLQFATNGQANLDGATLKWELSDGKKLILGDMVLEWEKPESVDSTPTTVEQYYWYISGDTLTITNLWKSEKFVYTYKRK